MYAWGSTIHGELGFGGVEPEHITTPTKLNWILSSCVKEAVLGDNHTLFLMNDSKVYSCGNNDYGQLGHQNPRKRPQPVAGLDYHQITSVACGSMHSMALNSWGQVLAWGSDFHGQLGHQNGEHIQPIPKVVQALSTYTIIQIACGSRHSLALANNGDILAWGSNKFGQLGLGCFTDAEVAPKLVVSLTGLPVSFIACGSNHSFCLSKSGAVYGWGKNTKGQLGLSDTDNKKFPTQLRSLRNIRVRYISCGEEFSMFLTIDGGVLTCGGGMYGQLGHGNNKNELLPRQVAELMGSTITQISCGRQHSLALVPSRGHVYSFGIGGCGQLGLNKMINVFTPNVVLGPWVSPGDTSVIASGRKDENLVVHRLFTGGDHCFVSVEKQGRNKSLPEFDHRTYQPETQILDLNQKYAQTLQTIGNDAIIDPKIFTYCEIVFKSLACLNGSFLLPHDKHYFCHSNHHGVDMAVAEDVFNMIGTVENSTINEIIWNGITEHVIPQLCSSPPDVETLRVYLTLPLYHQFNNPKQYLKLQKVYALAALKLHTQASRVLQMWWSSMNCDYFERMVNVFRDVASYIIRSQSIQQGKTVVFDSSLVAMLEMLKIFNRLNSDGIKVPFETFHISEITDLLDIRIDYVYWLCDSSPNKLYLCNYAFVFDTQAKLQLLMTDQSIQKETAMQGEVNQFLILNVSRQNIVEDSLRELSNCIHLGYDLKKPLKIKFIGEEAEDIGGVSKEFFMLLLREILDAKYGMFIEYEESRTIWFADNTFEDKKVYFLIGMICGLAIYNYTIIDIPFPLALYKMLLNEPVNLQDLRGLTPSLADSLQALLEYTDPDFKDVYGSVRFDITRNIWGDVRVYDLIPNGSNIPVTQENKTDFVDLYVKFILTDSVKTQFKGFYDGFMKVCGCRVLKLFHSHELMSVVVGNEDYDWDALEEAAVYKGDYKSSDPTIRWFWEVLHEMCFDDKRKFLLFLTGCNRIPIQGMKAIKLIIQPTNDEKYLPVAHTCFNMLDLPRYGTKERLRYKLMQAIQQTEGFSLV